MPSLTVLCLQPLLGEQYEFYDYFPKREYGITVVTCIMLVILFAGIGLIGIAMTMTTPAHSGTNKSSSPCRPGTSIAGSRQA